MDTVIIIAREIVCGVLSSALCVPWCWAITADDRMQISVEFLLRVSGLTAVDMCGELLFSCKMGDCLDTRDMLQAAFGCGRLVYGAARG